MNGSLPTAEKDAGRHTGDYLDGDGFTYCQECTETTGDYVLVADCPRRGGSDA